MAFASTRLQSIRVVASTSARTASDALRLAHDGGVEAGFLEPRPSGMRFSQSMLNPGSYFVVAYADESPVASLIVTEDGPFGLPSDRSFAEELDQLRSAGTSLFEAGGWAVKSEWRRFTVHLGAFLLGTVLRENLASTLARRMVACVEPERAEMLSWGFCGEHLVGPRPYLGLPGTLVITHETNRWVEQLTGLHESQRGRAVASRAFDPDPTWLSTNIADGSWLTEIAPTLLRESSIDTPIRAQLALIDGVLESAGGELSRGPSEPHQVVLREA